MKYEKLNNKIAVGFRRKIRKKFWHIQAIKKEIFLANQRNVTVIYSG